LTKYSHLNTHLPYGSHQTDSDDMNSVAQIIRSDFLTTGPAVANFEHALAEKTGASHVVACSSGTAALHMAALAIGLGEGDVAIVPSVTFLSTASAVRMVGAEVEFCDVDPYSGLMRPEDLKEALSRVPSGKAKAVFPVHFAGQIPDMENISAIARENGLHVVEDSCHSLGSTYKGSGEDIFQAGSCRHSDIAVFSFHPVKTITMGEGGAICTGNKTLANRLMRLRSHGMIREPANFTNKDEAFSADGTVNSWYYEMHEIGLNYRVSDINCALGQSQLKKLDMFVRRRRSLANYYDELLPEPSPLIRPLAKVANCDPAWHLYVVLIDFANADTNRAALIENLRERGIGTQVHYIPVHIQPYYQKRYGNINLPGAMSYYRRCLTLPLFPSMEKTDVCRVVDTLKEVLEIG
jgi:UDP-4-amino-4,6-dideoxy-N-acetyl-beta-L-altrosamine transaminase